MMTKAVITAFKNGGDDKYYFRLLSYLKKHFLERIIRLTPLRGAVYYLETPSRPMILKGYSSYAKLSLQENFTETLKKEGFDHTYSFLRDVSDEPLYFEGLFFGCIEYFQADKRPFQFDSQTNRKAGLKILNKFHTITASFVHSYKELIPVYNIEQKWKDRTSQFIKNIPMIQYFLGREQIDEIVNWADWSLEGMEKCNIDFAEEPYTILHGDLAHHNFFRTYEGELKLIDFDLISIGPKIIDHLQYANRIMPFLSWKINSLFKYKYMKDYVNSHGFLYAIGYPTDLLREWNRLIREKSYDDERKMKYTLELTVQQFYLRKQFIKDLKRQIRSL
ncbi:hypothetical protein [Bacillus sp. cl95]|nr:hypothetical protein [Bacillus sp. cl95]SFA94472.1 hypothetical protein SAMN02799634_1032 [Bacillus sp. UNCCL13]SFQ78428.1 hypothetical protein SAMN04488577_1638 [Bacillus sp. cl95]